MTDRQILSKYLHPEGIEKTFDLLRQHKTVLRISGSRSSKLGDFRPQHRDLPHRISVNHDLNPHEFLITLLHELAHMVCWANHGKRVKSHGKEWKQTFRMLYQDFYEPDVIPEDVHQAMLLFFDPKTSYRGGNEILKRTLGKYDPESELIAIENIPDGETFTYHKRTFRKLEKVRKRYKCICLNNKRLYSFNPLAQVMSPDGSQ